MKSNKSRNDTPKAIKARALDIHEALIDKRYTTHKIIGSKGDVYTMFHVTSSKGRILDKICTCKGYFYRQKCYHVGHVSQKMHKNAKK